MKSTISFSALKVMSPARREERLSALIQSTQRLPNGEIEQLDVQVSVLEQRNGMDSATMRRRLAAGEIDETPEIASWLMVLLLRERLAERATRPR